MWYWIMGKTPKILLANPRGLCAGVNRAIGIVVSALTIFKHPIYVKHEVVHNRFVVEGLRQRGAIFVEDLSEIPDKSVVIFSAHGVSRAVRKEAKDRALKVFDATCPLVTKVHMEVTRASNRHTEVVLIGHSGHPEVEGTMGQYVSERGGIYLVEDVSDVDYLVSKIKDSSNLCYVSQTTLSIDETMNIIERLNVVFPRIHGPKKDDICYATQNRQNAVKKLAKQVDVMVVVGSSNSSNSNRLRELAERLGTPSFLIDDPKKIRTEWFKDAQLIGVTAGASAPEELVNQIISKLRCIGVSEVEEVLGKEETVFFDVPKELRIKKLN